ncbi:DNA mismatch repair endonuclease MutL [Methanomethylovorans sp.]|uniref:DNA mismatch repair endonuclease MutL n=1 Tax=Methanomethylovorans sp. TaxID=2758717 RepID=UPI002FDC9AD9
MAEDLCDVDSNRIHLLDEATISKIAAGEVIERPASAVKELLDNSIDAGATEIKVEIEGSGVKRISVRDNGHGMSHMDASMAFKKHATSKLTSIDDLELVRTLGFRGEALSSMAAVAKVTLITRRSRDVAGTKVMAGSDGVKSILEVGAPVGTTVEVADLFHSTPARRKYLKSSRTELAHITEVLTNYAIAHPVISFTLLNEGKVVLRSPATNNMFDNIVHIHGAEVARSLVPVVCENELVKISGYVSKPELSRSGSDLQSFYINGRSIYSKAISNAIRLGYYTLLPKGRYPAAFLKLEIDPRIVDVNVHPRKTEVRLSHEKEIMDFVTAAVENALSSTHLVPEIKVKDKPFPVQKVLYEDKDEDESKLQDKLQNKVYLESRVLEEPTPYHPPPKDTERRLKASARLQSRLASSPHDEEPVFVADDVKVMGQFEDLYIVAEVEKKLLLIDQHAAHERVMYERVLDSRDMGWQELLNPVTLELNPKEKIILEEFVPYLEEVGFSISEFGPDTYVVTTVPTIFGRMESPDVVHDIVSDLLSVGRIKDDTEIYDHVFSTMACRAAIKAGAVCNKDQMADLIRQLKKCRNPYTCPHGRPTMISFTREELDRMFKRTG